MSGTKFTVFQLTLYSIGFAMLFAALYAMTYNPPAKGGEALVAYIYVQLGILSGHILGVKQSQSPDAPAAGVVVPAPVPTLVAPAGQVGRSLWAYPVLLLAIALAGMSLLGGCTTTTASIYSGLYTQAKSGVQVFDDNTLSTMKDLFCAQPYSAIQRHPEIQPGVAALCGSMPNTASLDPSQVMQMLSIAKQLGLVPAAAPAAVVPK